MVLELKVLFFYQTSSRSKAIAFTDRYCAQKSTQFNQRYRAQRLMLYQPLYRSKVRAFSKPYRARRFVPLLGKRVGELVGGASWVTTQTQTKLILKTAETRTRL